MLLQKHRLKKTKDIEIVFENGRFVGGKYATMKVWHIDPAQFPKRGYAAEDIKVAVVVSKKVDKRAVQRNRLKRQMREVIRLLLKEQQLRAGNMLIVMAKPEMVGVSYHDIAQDIIALLERGKVLQK